MLGGTTHEHPTIAADELLQEEKRKAKEMKKITERVEPEMLARAMLRSEDDVIRTTDIPEREQLRPSPEPSGWRDPNSTTLDDCAK
jgi:hypothetical protein